MTILSKKYPGFILVFFLVYVLSALYFSPYPKGSDQYWNTGNIDRVVNGDGLFKTNNIFPASMPEDTRDLPRPWLQNRPIVYLVTLFTFIGQDANATFVVINCLLIFFSAYLIFKIMLKDDPRRENMALLFAAMFLLFPMNYYLATQALPEIFNQFLAIAIGYLLICKPINLRNGLVVAFLTGLLIYQRDTNAILVPLIAVFYIMYSRRPVWVLSIGSLLAIIFLFYLVRPYILPSHTIEPLKGYDVVTQVRPGTSDMANYLYTDLPHIPLGTAIAIVMEKFVDACKTQFIPEKATSLFFVLFDMLLVPFVWVLSRYKKLNDLQRKTIMGSGIFILLHLATVVLFRNQYRFSAIVVPYLFICLFLLICSFPRPSSYIGKVLLIPTFVFVVINAFAGMKNRGEAFKEHETVLNLRRARQQYIGDSALLIHRFDAANSLIAAYSFSPNLCFYFPGDQDLETLFAIGKKLHTNKMILKKTTSVYDRFKPYIIHEQMIDTYKDLVLVEVSIK